MLEHGGKLRLAAQRYGIPLEQWMDLSTGINPNGWQGELPPMSTWARLPEDEDGLVAAAMAYYDVENLLPVAGSQAAIQTLPKLRTQSRVAVLSPSYNEHAHAWQCAGHDVELVTFEQLHQVVERVDVLVLVNPNNPTGATFDQATLLQWHQTLAQRQGWLIVDEAFMDSTPDKSLAKETNQEGLIVLRSIGKFFGLAGARVGFVLAQNKLLAALQEALGPWTVSGPSRWLATQALKDFQWQSDMMQQLKQQSQRLNLLLQQNNLIPSGDTTLFQTITAPYAAYVHEQLAQQGVLTRLFIDASLIRFGLPKDEVQWQKLAQVLAALQLNQEVLSA